MEEVAVPMFFSLVSASILIVHHLYGNEGFQSLGILTSCGCEVVCSVNFRLGSLDFKLGISKEKIVAFNVCLSLEDNVTWLP